ncbi:unnamed protein product [Polarella glacialis]|uniref:Uncharacterized protein n=1 Tax=Polarella glacialis TaxID=89957 RepID=A0A813LNF2_POLGL|nr:unnamed protein product [Polarella glacialis]
MFFSEVHKQSLGQWSPNGKYLAAAAQNRILIRNAESLKLVQAEEVRIHYFMECLSRCAVNTMLSADFGILNLSSLLSCGSRCQLLHLRNVGSLAEKFKPCGFPCQFLRDFGSRTRLTSVILCQGVREQGLFRVFVSSWLLDPVIVNNCSRARRSFSAANVSISRMTYSSVLGGLKHCRLPHDVVKLFPSACAFSRSCCCDLL